MQVPKPLLAEAVVSVCRQRLVEFYAVCKERILNDHGTEKRSLAFGPAGQSTMHFPILTPESLYTNTIVKRNSLSHVHPSHYSGGGLVLDEIFVAEVVSA